MITFEAFVKSLGEHATQYTPEELQKLHVDIQRFAQVIIAVYRSREERARVGSPPHALDDSSLDRTLEETQTSP